MQQENKRRMREIKWEKWIDSVAPPGIGTDREIGTYISGLVMFLVFSFSFFGNYNEAFSELYHWKNGHQVLREGAVMKDFITLVEGSLGGFVWYSISMLFVVVWHYMYYHYGTKSIYLMRRLPNRMEIHKRAWTLPLLGAAGSLLAAFVILVFYFEIYMIVTPKQCIAPGQWQNIWR